MRTFLFITFGVVLFITNHSKAQDASKIKGTYAIQEIRTSEYIEDYRDTLYYDIKIESSTIDSFDIQFFLPTYINDTVRATLLNDSTFQFDAQCFEFNIDDEIELLCIAAGGGFITVDSIIMNFGFGGPNGLFESQGKGILKNGTGMRRSITSEPAFLVYPNPANDILYFDLQPADYPFKDFTANIYNNNGLLVLQKTVEIANKGSINVSKLNSGIYFIELMKNNTTEYSGKFIKK